MTKTGTTQSTPSNVASSYTSIGGTKQKYVWHWNQQAIAVAYETRGEGTPMLLLPALSTVSSRGEMREIAAGLSDRFQVVALDWPGFGDSDRPALDYCPQLYHQFLADFVASTFDRPIAIVAAGHASGYAMRLAKMQPERVDKVVLVAPTWRGPLRVMGVPDPVRDFVREMVRTPVLGDLLYDLNTQPAFLQFMYEQHVFVDKAHLTPEFIAQKQENTQHAGGRFAPVAFVTGTLDPASDRAEFLGYFQPLPVPVKVIIGDRVPSGSRTEMQTLTQLPGVLSEVRPGSLGMHEEYPAAVLEAIGDFV
ncbi:alpha/beta fold hydrolase [Phormidium sp. CCY1219]|uniref:alpha/beta fold hydrolase n=1 Tax=Phormidium sp. CCY1219 TaxID=2886104 RepID=UPI002D1F7AB6|nr:alpha/beta hydrolase [Phormidium sp. CCY1219]MEB3831815.1 alpha/beta hydrolase [Phormidium sp. CCY1219]